MTKLKRIKRIGDRKQFRFNTASWGACVSIESWFWETKNPVNGNEYARPSKFKIVILCHFNAFLTSVCGDFFCLNFVVRQFRTYLHILGGCDLHSRTVTDSHIAVNYHSKFV